MTKHSDWQRVSPVAMVYFTLKGIPHLVNLWPILIPAFAGGDTVQALFWQHGLPALAVLMLLGVVLQYWFFSFRLEGECIALRSGVLNRKRLTLDFERVQQADIAHPFYFRPFQLATLGLESAGSAQQEVDIPGIPIAFAEQLRQRVLEVQRRDKDLEPSNLADNGKLLAGSPTSADASIHLREAETPDFELRLKPADIARYGLMQNTLLYLAPLAAPLGQQAGPLFETALASIEHSQLYYWFEWISGNLAISLGLILAVAAVLFGTTILFGLSVILALLRYWGYHLTRVGERYQYRAGLTTIRTRGFKVQKLQKVAIYQGVIARLLRRYTAQISKAGGIAQTGAVNEQKFLVPVLTASSLKALCQELNLPAADWRRVHRWFWLGPVCFLLPVCLIAALVGVKLTGVFAASVLLLLPLMVWVTRRRWRWQGYWHNGEWLAVRSRFIGFSEQWLPAGKLQKIKLSQSPLARMMGVVTVHVWGADGHISIPCVPEADGVQLRDSLLADVVAFNRPWF